MADSKLPAEEAVYDDEDETVVSERKKRKGFVGCLINNWFMVTTIIGVIIGFGAGFGIQRAGLDETGKTWLGESRLLQLLNPSTLLFTTTIANVISVDRSDTTLSHLIPPTTIPPPIAYHPIPSIHPSIPIVSSYLLPNLRIVCA
uniref:Solute carrier family 1 protein n=1 Tax=Echinococcus granulosus TaxID=6210 RepID=A0A068WVK9_ECHGR|nr:solute carrier family 1 protein [Echinococcus granulosus]